MINAHGGMFRHVAQIVVNGNFALASGPGAVVQSTGIVGDTANATAFKPAGVARLVGNSAVIEVMSRDVGVAGFVDRANYVYGTIELAGANARLINAADNVVGAEALYVNNLIVPSGTALILNGLNVYARATQINGTLIGGTINSVSDGGPVNFAQQYPGQILNVGEVDVWTFFGRSGRGFSLSVSPKNGNLASSINYVSVEVLKPDGSVLTWADNTIHPAGTALNLLALTLPSDGIYTGFRYHTVDQPFSVGRYVLTAYDSTANDETLPLNKQVSGSIKSAYAIDRWRFSANANTQVLFDLVNRSNTNLVFTFTGPQGQAIFVDRSADSEPIDLQVSRRVCSSRTASTRTPGNTRSV